MTCREMEMGSFRCCCRYSFSASLQNCYRTVCGIAFAAMGLSYAQKSSIITIVWFFPSKKSITRMPTACSLTGKRQVAKSLAHGGNFCNEPFLFCKVKQLFSSTCLNNAILKYGKFLSHPCTSVPSSPCC